jgi:hypothetical protein
MYVYPSLLQMVSAEKIADQRHRELVALRQARAVARANRKASRGSRGHRRAQSLAGPSAAPVLPTATTAQTAGSAPESRQAAALSGACR